MRTPSIVDMIEDIVDATNGTCLVVGIDRTTDISHAVALGECLNGMAPGSYDRLNARGLLVFEYNEETLDPQFYDDILVIRERIVSAAKADGVAVQTGISSQNMRCDMSDFKEDEVACTEPQTPLADVLRAYEVMTNAGHAHAKLTDPMLGATFTDGFINMTRGAPRPLPAQPTPEQTAFLIERMTPVLAIGRAQAACTALGVSTEYAYDANAGRRRRPTSEAGVLIARCEGRLGISPKGPLGKRLDKVEAAIQKVPA